MAEVQYLCEDPTTVDPGALVRPRELPEGVHSWGSLYIEDNSGPHSITVLIGGEDFTIPLEELGSYRYEAEIVGLGTFTFCADPKQPHRYVGKDIGMVLPTFIPLTPETTDLLEIAAQLYDITFTGYLGESNSQ